MSSSRIDYSRWDNIICSSDDDSTSSRENARTTHHQLTQRRRQQTQEEKDPLQNFPSYLKERIIEKIQINKLTVLVGPTGCGKSTLVPQVLLDSFGPSILCTQPRRLAVFAVATHVAKQRNVVLGEEVGYHVGQDRVTDFNGKDTGLTFCTAGILLEELRVHGLDAIEKYKVVIIDECHERSTESDLCLTIIKEFMVAYPRSKLRLVLMSATFDHARYTNFFRGVPGCEYVDTITLQTAESINAFYTNVDTLYLEDVTRMLKFQFSGLDNYYMEYCTSIKRDPMKEMYGKDGGKTLSQQLLNLIFVLVAHLDQEEESDSIFLIFAPTYRHLEQIYKTLIDTGGHSAGSRNPFDVRVLHSSVDMEDCLNFMQGNDSAGTKAHTSTKTRKVFLASAIADSSITIPGVTCVIDICRALEVRWDSDRSAYNPKTTWASQSICDQRRGRTGRTCAGRVFRLVHQSFYNNDFDKWEQPKLELASCRDEILSLLSSSNKIMSDPQVLLERCLDPPSSTTVTKAIQYLKDIGACEEQRTSRGRKVVPTDHGRLISSLPFTVEDAGVIIHGAKNGLLHESLALVAIKAGRPQPIVHEFGEGDFNQKNLRKFYNHVDMKNPMSVPIAHFGAYVFWRVNWMRIKRQGIMAEFSHRTNGASAAGIRDPFFETSTHLDEMAHDCNVSVWTPEMDVAHTDWCKRHSINPSSVRAVEECVASTLKTLHHSNFQPEWLRCQKAEPEWNLSDQFDFEERFGMYDVFSSVYGSYKGTDMSESLLIELQEKSLSQRRDRIKTKTAVVCIHFLRGNCTFGEDCKNSHTASAPRPLCHFYSRPGGCTNPRCIYSHEEPVSNDESVHSDASMMDPIHAQFEGGPLAWFRMHSSSLLLFGEGDFSFSRALELLRATPAIASTNDEILPVCSVVRQYDFVGLDATRCHINQTLDRHPLNSRIVKCAWNFPSLGQNDSDTSNESLLRGFFMSVAAYFENKYTEYNDSEFEVGLALQGNEFSRWNILNSAQNAGFVLEWWDDFQPSSFPNYNPRQSNNDAMRAKQAQFYVFRLKRRHYSQ